MHIQRVKTKEQGASLIQILVGIAVAAFVLVMAGEMYYTVRHSYTRTVTQLVDNTEASVVAQTFRNLVDQSTSPSLYGLWPWQQVEFRVPSLIYNPLSYPPVYAASSLNFYAPPSHVVGTDILMLQGITSHELLSQDANPDTNNHTVSVENSKCVVSNPYALTNTLTAATGDYILLSDSMGHTLMRLSHNSTATVQQGPSRTYRAGSFLGVYKVYIIYLRETGGVRSLMLNTDYYNVPECPNHVTSSQEIAQNVTDLQIRYYANAAWSDVQADGTPNYLEPWYKAVKGIEIRYTVSGQVYTILIALKANVL